MAGKRRDLSKPPVGARFGDLTVIGFHGKDIYSHAIWAFRCKCDLEVKIRASSVLARDTKRCPRCSKKAGGPGRTAKYADRDAVLIDLFASGGSFDSIAAERRISRNVVAGVIHRARRKGLLIGRTKVGAAA